MKKTSKPKKNQSPKGNLKISHFFRKLDPVQHKKARSTEQVTSNVAASKSTVVSTVVVIDSDDDFEKTKEQLECKNCHNNVQQPSSSSVNNSDDDSVFNKKQSSVQNSPAHTNNGQIFHGSCGKQIKKRKLNSLSQILSPERKKRSPHNGSDTNGIKTSPSDTKTFISVKTPDKLFSSSFLSDNSHLVTNEVKSTTNVNNQQPKLNTSGTEAPLKDHDLNIMVPTRSKKTPVKTPRKSPKVKLFHKSPQKLEAFNVQVIDNFIRITPSKSNKDTCNDKSPGSSAKKQVSILQYMSPPLSSSKEAQQVNETTPKKASPISKQVTPQLHSKAKARLDFSSCQQIKTEPGTSSDLDVPLLAKDFEDDWDVSFNDIPIEFNLDLEKSKHCKVLESIETRNRITIKVQSTSSTDRAICYVEGFWMAVHIKPEDTLYLQAVKHPEGNWVVDNDIGLLIYEPDLLISSTSVVRSVFCMRRSVLAERYQGFEPANRIMVIGILIHTLLQNVLRNKIQTVKGIEKTAEEIMSTNSAIRKMYESSLTADDVRKELMQFVPKIMNFVREYVQADMSKKVSSRNVASKPWSGKIDCIDDIEENIWCPQLGVKGKVDVSVRSKDKIYPLELKTGRASMSLEHKGQVMLYVMMMNTLGYEISSGLLHYLREGLLTEVNASRQETRDIIILRNELAYFLMKMPEYENVSPDDASAKRYFVQELPEPIDHYNACKKCPYNVICSAHIPYEKHDISLKKNFSNIQKESIAHLEKDHLDYFIHWSFLLSLENISQKDSKALREIYTVPPDVRAKHGRCINGVSVINIEAKSDSIIEHTFGKNGEPNSINFLCSGIVENNYVVVSTDKRPAVASGFVIHISAATITLSLDRDLSKKYSKELFHLDTYDSCASTAFNMTSLALLLEDSTRSDQLRKIIINKQPPAFFSKLPKVVAVKSVPILKRLNKSQQRAVLKSLSAKDYLLIKGMPGTGKTATIVALVQLLVEVNKTVLITSHTHSAIDNVCLRLQKFGVDVLRLGSMAKINEQIKLRSEYTLTKDCKTPEEIEQVYNSAQVIAVTCLGSGHPLLSKRVVDVCLVDESTQVLQTSVLRALHCAKTFILIGDPDQLAPTIKSREAVKRGMSESLFERLDVPEACVMLNENYRMNKTITALANALTYNGELLIGNESIANACLVIPNEMEARDKYKNELWIWKCLDTSLEASVQILNTNLDNFQLSSPQGSNTDNNSCVNIYEAFVVAKLVNVLLEACVPKENIGVIATYRDQVARISRILRDVDVSTVDQFQGKDKSVILYSCTKWKQSELAISEYNLLENHRRLTVAITRAKHKLIIIGELNVIRQHKPFMKLLNSLDESRFVKLEEGKSGFSWENLQDEFSEGGDKG